MNKKAETELENIFKGLAFIGFVIAIITYPYISKINHYLSIFWLWAIAFLIAIFLYLVLFGLTYIGFKSGKFVFKKATYGIKKKQEKANLIQIETSEIENLLDEKLIFDEQSLTKDIEIIKRKINFCKSNNLFRFIPELKKRLAKATELLEELEEHKRADNLEIRNSQLKEENEILEKLNKEKIIQQENKKEAILYRFNSKEDNVFFKENLTEEEIQALTENGYYPVAEYDIVEKKYVNVLVKPVLKHSPTHIFLVWNAKKLLEKIKGVENIYEHLSVDADITFRFQGKVYALEIETGTLLGKTKQIKEKLAYLNKKYPKRWMFIVSNKNLLSKYRKLGPSTPRSEVAEKLQKLLENAHPILRGGK